MHVWSLLVVVAAAMPATHCKFAYRKDAQMDILDKDQQTIKHTVHSEPVYNKNARIEIPKVDQSAVKVNVIHDPLPTKMEQNNLEHNKSTGLDTLLPSKTGFLDTKFIPKPDVSSEKLANDTNILKMNIAKYLNRKFHGSFSSGFNLFDMEVAKKMVAYYAKRAYNLYPDLSAAAVQWMHPSINNRNGDMYKVYGRSRIPGDQTCPHHVNETIACALQISNPVVNKILKRLGY